MTEKELEKKIKELTIEFKIIDNYERHETEVDEERLKKLESQINNYQWALDFYRRQKNK